MVALKEQNSQKTVIKKTVIKTADLTGKDFFSSRQMPTQRR